MPNRPNPPAPPVSKSARIREAMCGVMGSETYGIVMGAFHMMGIAEEEIEAAGIRLTPCDPFRHCMPSEAFHRVDDWVYRAHVRELVARAKAGGDLRPGTLAEVVLAFMETCLRAPLDTNGTQAYRFAYCTIAPDHGESVWGTAPSVGELEMWEGATAETLDEVRRRIRVEDRKL